MADQALQQWCQPHWDELRIAIEARGLGALISRGGAAAAAHVADELRLGTSRDVEGFDPLLRAWSMIAGRALDMSSGLIGYPLCYVQRHYDECQQPNCDKPLPADWVAGCADSLRKYAQDLGFIG